MRFRSILTAARGELVAHPTRTILAAASVIVGITCLVVVVALTGKGEAAIRSDLERTAGRAQTFQLEGLNNETRLSSAAISQADHRLTALGVHSKSHYDGYQAATPMGGSVDLYAVDPSYARVRPLGLISGRWINASDTKRLPVSLIANERAWDELGSKELGSVLDLRVGQSSVSVRLTGEVDDGRADPTVYVSYIALNSRSIYLPSPNYGYLFAVSPSAGKGTSQEITRTLHDIGSTEAKSRRIDAADDFTGVFRAVQGVGFGAAAIALIAGSLGFLNLGLASVQQRVRDFGVLRSFGASRRAVFLTVLMESIVVTLAAGAVSILSSWLILQVVPTIGGIDLGGTELPLNAVLAGLSVSVVLGLIVGIIPARLATGVDVIEAIRIQ